MEMREVKQNVDKTLWELSCVIIDVGSTRPKDPDPYKGVLGVQNELHEILAMDATQFHPVRDRVARIVKDLEGTLGYIEEAQKKACVQYAKEADSLPRFSSRVPPPLYYEVQDALRDEADQVKEGEEYSPEMRETVVNGLRYVASKMELCRSDREKLGSLVMERANRVIREVMKEYR